MQLTKGQKEAIARKVEAIVAEKRAAIQEKYKKEWKPSAEVNALLKAVKKVNDARLAYIKAVNDAGFDFKYSAVIVPLSEWIDAPNHNFNISHDSLDMDIIDKLHNKVMELQLNQRYSAEEGKMFPDKSAIMDDIELLDLSKSFDLEKFLDKYKNL
jgi:hypothetical protein